MFVPGNNPRFIQKSKKLRVDIVCLDLEDSVPDDQKAHARDLIRDALKARDEYPKHTAVYVRTNSFVSGCIPADLEAVVQEGLDGVVIPKVDDTQQLSKIQEILKDIEQQKGLNPIGIIPSIESTKGVVNTYEIASYGERIQAVVFGVFDLLNDMGIEYTKDAVGAVYSRSKVPVDARAAGIPTIDGIWQDLEDEQGLTNDCKIGKGLGYIGKSVIHPAQVPIIHETFHPDISEIKWARKVYTAYSKSVKTSGKGAITIDGKMIDEVHYKQAKTLLGIVDDYA